MTYSKEAEKQGWTETTIDRLTGGINTQTRADLLTVEQALQVENLRILKNTLARDTGYNEFAVGGAQDALDSAPQAVIQFYKKNGSSELVCITQGSVYTYSTSKKEWHYVKADASTTLNANHVAADTNLTVVDSTGFAIGRRVGLILDSGYQFRTVVTAVPDGTHVTVEALPSDASTGNAIVQGVNLSGTDDFAVSVQILPSNDWLAFTNNVNVPYRYDGSDCVPIPGLPSSGNVKCKSLAIYNNALFLIGTTEGGTDYPQRVRRSEIGDPSTWSGGTAGYDDLLDTADYLISAENLGPYLIVYKERTIYRAQFLNTGGVYYSFDPVVKGEGLAAYQGIVDMGDYHIFIGNSNVYEYRGDFSIDPIGDNVFYNLFAFDADINTEYKLRAFAFFVEELNEVWMFFASSSSEYPDVLYRYSITEEAWVIRKFTHQFVGYGFYQTQSDFTWNDLVGSWLDQTWRWNSRVVSAQSPTTLLCATDGMVYEYDYLATTEAGSTPSVSIFESRDFVNPDGEFRTDALEVQMRGSNITVEYSTDEGDTWRLWATVSSTQYRKHRMHKQVVTDTIRFRIKCSASIFALRWMNLVWRPESERK